MELRYILLFALPLLGGILALFVTRVDKDLLKLILAFSGAFLFSITIVDILPAIYQREHTLNNGVLILVGFFFQIVLEYFTKGIEHGHLHHNHGRKHFPFAVVAGLCIHSFIEGIPLSNIGLLNDAQRYRLIYGIALHEAPAAFTLITLLRYNKVPIFTTFIVLILYACMSLLGISASTFSTRFRVVDEAMLQNILALVVGTFLHISTTILFENSENHSFSKFKLLAISLGVGLALLI